jgi:alkylation response protein AidB-like acyl-CoA dehydrogenase
MSDRASQTLGAADASGVDPFADPPHIEQIRSDVRTLCAQFPEAYWRDLDHRRAYPEEFVRALTDAGWLAALIPAEYGGLGYGLQEAAAILQEINQQGGYAGPAHAQIYVMGALLRHGAEDQKARWLPLLADGTLRLQAFAVTEPDAGTDTTRIETTAALDGDEYVISGRKIFISRVRNSDLMLILTRTSPRDEQRPTAGLSLFLVDLREAGDAINVRPLTMLMNNDTNELTIDGLRVPAENLVGGEGEAPYPRRLERGAHSDRRRMRRRWPLVHQAGDRIRQVTRGLRAADRRQSGDSVSDCLGLGAGRGG